MFFQKNLPMWERALRMCVGVVVIVLSLLYPLEAWVKWVAIAGGVIFACTGFIGFCPMCAMVGRKLPNQN